MGPVLEHGLASVDQAVLQCNPFYFGLDIGYYNLIPVLVDRTRLVVEDKSITHTQRRTERWKSESILLPG